ncbi:MAG TPA: methyltransferase domain-containing protein [Thermoanaerobaculia bacterium]|nr:methyltransferase domain-containing protein [Thermoanaerobaculia bacterium]
MRRCGLPLRRQGATLVCPTGHSYDVARSGYVNLLQPQDRRSLRPGDSRQAAMARRRLFERGLLEPQVGQLLEAVAALELPARPAVLDVGCGEGSFLGALAGEREVAAHGLDISAAAVDLAARRDGSATWVVANADLSLPYAAGCFDLLLSLTARLNPREFWRVLADGARLLVAVPGAEDLMELRQALLGAAVLRDRLAPAVSRLESHFELASQSVLRYSVLLDAAAIHDLLAATYRGARNRERARLAGLGELRVTMSRQLASFSPRARPPAGP